MDATQKREQYRLFLLDTQFLANEYVRYALRHIQSLPGSRTTEFFYFHPPQYIFPRRREFPPFRVLFAMVAAILNLKFKYKIDWNAATPLQMLVRWSREYKPDMVRHVELEEMVIPSDLRPPENARIVVTPERAVSMATPVVSDMPVEAVKALEELEDDWLSKFKQDVNKI